MRGTAPDAPPDAGVLVCLCTFPDLATGERIARALVEARVAACVKLLPGATSVYRWQGRVEMSAEVQGFIKTCRDRLDALKALIRKLHPYEVPELVAVEAVGGLPAYLHWVADETLPPDAAPAAHSAPD